ncbi:AAA family ATPase [Paraburkholderia sp. A1RI_3L]|uniref:ATP-dependent nuclease n=1 Tax=Paraburkholderia TaxID=1822464 RepID=UPI003B7807F6
MKLRRVVIKNFRKLADIDFDLSQNLSVIVGPNAVGKSTIFEAIRLAKAVLFPRTHDELRLVLVSLGATSAHFMQGQFQYDISALAGDIDKPVTVGLTIEFSNDEIESIRQAIPQITRNLVATQLGRQPNDPTLDLTAYFATPMGQKAQLEASKTIVEAIKNLDASNKVEARIDINQLQIQGSSTLNNLFIAHLEQRLVPEKTIFSYFPADRSMPAGEVAIQIGPQDFKAQLDSHFSQAISKYGRLKQTVVNRAILARINDTDLKPEFDSIFDTFLPGKRFVGLSQKPTGLVSVLVRDDVSQKTFDIDSLSSGEKGLVLSFLLFKTALALGSIVLVDELELHLNPAVCRKIIPYLAEHVAKNFDCQFIISTHSAEITRDAYERDDTALFHLRSGTDISPVLKQDVYEVVEAIRRLGVSAEQALTAKATVFVEGDTDISILEAAFPELLSGVQLRALHGRTEVEKSIRELQEAERKGVLKERQGFLFDNDRKTTNLSSTDLVKIEQLERYCLENYLIDETILFDLIKIYATNPPESRGRFSMELKGFAINQLDSVILNEMLSEFREIRNGLRSEEIKGRSVAEIANIQLERLSENQRNINTKLANKDWVGEFERIHASKRAEREPLWQNDWKVLCSGKILLESVQRTYQVNIDLTKFKCMLAAELARKNKDDITALKGIIGRLLPS